MKFIFRTVRLRGLKPQVDARTDGGALRYAQGKLKARPSTAETLAYETH
jgi:hypothetical protein